MKLNYRVMGEGKPVIILHGVFGSSDNWQTVGKKLADQFKIFLVDLRNHGLSPHSEAMNYTVMVDDILELMTDESMDSTSLVGHSMGGKVVMNLAVKHPDKVDKLVVVDIAPKFYPPHHQSILAAFHELNISEINSRQEADHQLSINIKDFGVRQFILKNLGRNEKNEFEWKINYQAIEENIDNLGKGLPADTAFSGSTLFINGLNSEYITEEDFPLIRKHFPAAKIQGVEGAGHWVHAQKPLEMIQILSEFLS